MPFSAPTKRGMPRKTRLIGAERREGTRRRVLYPAYLHYMRRRFRCRLVEISGSGICLSGAPVLEPGTPVMIESLLFGRRGAVVAHLTGTRLGLALIGPPLAVADEAKGPAHDD